ncbi:MAG TPA: glycosyltransferase family protein [Kofleriaceae bacterium]|nr:glycosyltransferase family protein [Kofleriaceae bacterium]
MKTVAIVQARLGSSRLPGKVLQDLAGDTMLARVVARLRAARTIDDIVIATTMNESDDPVVREAARLGVHVWRGSETNVLARYIGAARKYHAGAVVRVTSDCPLLDPETIDRVVSSLRAAALDYSSNTHVRTYPRGLDVEAFYLETLEKIFRSATSAAAKEHVTAYVMEKPGEFAIHQVSAEADDSDLRWTVDTAEDLALVRTLFRELGLATIRPYREVVGAVRARPELNINAHITQKNWRDSHVA